MGPAMSSDSWRRAAKVTPFDALVIVVTGSPIYDHQIEAWQ